MKDENQLPKITCSLEDVVSAWFVCGAIMLSLLGISIIREMPEFIETGGWVGDENPVRPTDVFVDELELGDLRVGLIEPEATAEPGYSRYTDVTNSSH